MQDIGLEIKNLNNVINRNFKNLNTVKLLDEITGSNGYILGFLLKNKDKLITQKSIEKTLGITRSTASTVLTRMEKKELIRRETLESDSRVKRILVTEKGRDLSSKIDEEVKAFNACMMKDFTKEEIASFIEFIRRIKKNIGGQEND